MKHLFRWMMVMLLAVFCCLPWTDALAGELILPDSSAEVEAYAFLNCTEFTGTLAVPAGMTSIGAHAFEGCSGLTGLTLPADIRVIDEAAFANCTGLTGVVCIPPQCQVAENAFEGTSVTIIRGTDMTPYLTYTIAGGKATITACEQVDAANPILPDKLGGCPVTQIGARAFMDHTGLTGALTLPANLEVMGNVAFGGCTGLEKVTFPESMQVMYSGAFSECSGLTGELVLPRTMTRLGNSAFSYCTGLTSAILPESLEELDYDLFAQCSSLQHVTLPANLVEISGTTFYYCRSLQNIRFPQTLKSIGMYAFFNCNPMDTVIVPVGCSVDPTAFRNTSVSKIQYGFDVTPYLTYTIEDGQATITGCGSAAGVNPILPDTLGGCPVTAIAAKAFYQQTGLTGALTLPSGLTTLGDQAFYGCSGLTGELTVPDTWTVGADVFTGTGMTVTWPYPETNLDLTLLNYSVNNGEATIHSYDGWSAPAVDNPVIPMTLDGCPVVALDNNAFFCMNMTGTLTLPPTLQRIGAEAFSVNRLTGEIHVPASVTYLGRQAFRSCGSASIVYGCDTTMVFDYTVNDDGTATVTGYHGVPGNGDLEIPTHMDGRPVTAIAAMAFRRCTNFTGSLVLPDTITFIGESAFEECENLTGSLYLPKSLKTIDCFAFSLCLGLDGELVLPEGLEYINANAFDNSRSLSGTLKLPSTLKYVGYGAFVSCEGFTGPLTLPRSLEVVEGEAFAGMSGLSGQVIIPLEGMEVSGTAFSASVTVVRGTDLTPGLTWEINGSEARITACTGDAAVDPVVPDRLDGCPVTEIADGAFRDLQGLQGTLTIPATVTSVGDYAFSGCTGVTAVSLPDTLTSIGAYAFAQSGLMGELQLPPALTQVGDGAFQGCLLTGRIIAPNGCSVGENAFDAADVDLLIGVDMTDLIRGYIENGQFYVTDTTATDVLNPIFPDEAFGYPLTHITQEAFAGKGLSGTLVLPETLVYVGYRAFADNPGLSGEITVSADCYVDGSAFENTAVTVQISE